MKQSRYSCIYSVLCSPIYISIYQSCSRWFLQLRNSYASGFLSINKQLVVYIAIRDKTIQLLKSGGERCHSSQVLNTSTQHKVVSMSTAVNVNCMRCNCFNTSLHIRMWVPMTLAWYFHWKIKKTTNLPSPLLNVKK
jgi:hypothetical protein